MALLFMDTFDHYAYGDITRKWTAFQGNGSGSSSFSIATDFPGGGQYIQSSNANWGLYKTIPGATPATVVVGGWFQFNSLPTTADHLCAMVDGTTIQMSVGGDGAGHLTIGRAGTINGGASTTLFTSTNVVTTGVWYHIELKCTIHPSAGVCELRVNGSNSGWVTSQTGQNTRASGTSQVTGVSMAGNSGTYKMKLIYILDTTGASANDFLGVCRGVVTRPVAAGNYAQFTPNSGANWFTVADMFADGDVSFNGSPSAGSIDSFVWDDAPSAGTIFAIQHVIEARQDAGAARTIAAFERSAASGSTVDYVGTSQVLASAYLMYMDCRSVDPATNAQYTVSNFNASEFGYKLVA